jgi:cupin 2 domain-containing protein
MKIKNHNVFCRLPPVKKRESFRTLLKTRGVKIERIVSRGQATSPGKWLCSKTGEWVMVLRGDARLLFEGERKSQNLKAGDYVWIPAKTRHRVEWTHPKRKTVWLAVHVLR